MQGPALSTCDRCSCIVLQTRLISHYGRRPGHLSCFALRFVQGHEEETEPTTALFPGSKTSERCDAVASGSSISVAAPFVRRCLTGSTMAPLSHPAHRTEQADLSGSSAIAGFRPHRTHRAALPQWALQKGPEAGRSLPPCLVDHRFRKREGDQELAVVRPVHAAFLATFAEHLTPVLDDACLEHAQ